MADPALLMPLSAPPTVASTPLPLDFNQPLHLSPLLSGMICRVRELSHKLRQCDAPNPAAPESAPDSGGSVAAVDLARQALKAGIQDELNKLQAEIASATDPSVVNPQATASKKPTKSDLNRFVSIQVQKKRDGWVAAQNTTRNQLRLREQIESARDNSNIKEVLKMERIENSTWSELRKHAVEHFYTEMSKPNMKYCVEHCELNWVKLQLISSVTIDDRLLQIERKWAFVKQAIKKYTTGTMPGLVVAYKRIIPSLAVQTCRRFARKTRDYMRAYLDKVDESVIDKGVSTTYKGHR